VAACDDSSDRSLNLPDLIIIPHLGTQTLVLNVTVTIPYCLFDLGFDIVACEFLD
jgi:hypothetical protein